MRRKILALAGLSLVSLTGSSALAASGAIDQGVARHAEVASSARGIRAFSALREIWRRWDQIDPEQVEQAFVGVSADGRAAPEVRAYAGMLAAYARRRRGDLPAAKAQLEALGFVDRWLVVGPFDNEAKASLATPFGPEEDLAEALLVDKAYEGKERAVFWRQVPRAFPYGWLDLSNVVRPAEKGCVYAATFARAKDGKERQAALYVGVTGAFRAFMNGEEVLVDPAYRALDADRFGARVTLRAGWNRVTIKVCGDEEGAVLSARLARPDGLPDPELELSSDPVHAEEAKGNARRADRKKKQDKGITIVVAAKGDPYARGAKDAKPAARVPPPTLGTLRELGALLQAKRPDADDAYAAARFLWLTGGEEKGRHAARDLATAAATLAPTKEHLLFAADLGEDRNASARFIEKARALPGASDDEDVLLAQALHARSGMNFRDATPFFDQILAKDPANIPALLGRAELYAEAGLRQTALVTLERAATRVPRSVAVLRALSGQYRAVGRTTDAETVERRYAGLRADDVGYLRTQAEIAVAARDTARATRWLERMLALDPDSGPTADFAARSFRKLGEPARASALYEQRLLLVPEDVETLRALADLRGEEGKKDEELRLLRRVLALRPQAKEVREYLEAQQPPKIRKDEAYALEQAKLLDLSKQPAAAGTPRRTLHELTVTTVYPNGLASRFHQIVFQPLTEEAAAKARQFAFSFQSGREVVDVRRARVFRRDGKIDEAFETGEGPADDPSLAMYTSARTFFVQFPRISAGDIVELRYRVEEITPRNEFGDAFSETFYLGGTEPTLSVSAVVLAPKGKQLTFRVPAGFTRTDREDGELSVTEVHGEGLAPIVQEVSMPPLLELLPSVGVSSFATWDDVARWYWGLAKDQLDADDTVRKKAEELTKGLTTDEEKVRAIYEFVVQKTRYVALEFGIEGFRPRRCAQTLARGWGDCKDKATVIVTMLRELGIDANLVLVRSSLHGDAPTEPPSYALFDHAIAYVPKLDLFLDGTAEYVGMRELSSFIRGQPALIVTASGGRLVRVPDPPASQTVRARKIEVTVPDGAGGAALDLSVQATGALAAEWRQRYHATATQKGRIVEDFGPEFGGLSVQERGIDVGDLEDVGAPVGVRVRGKALGLARRGDGDLSFVAGPGPMLVSRYAALSSRTEDVRIPFAYTLDDTWTVKIPAGLKVKVLPEATTLSTPFGSLLVEAAEAGAKVTVHTRLTLDKTRVVPADYGAFRAFAEAADRALGARVVLGR